jgi:hypothetical protein
MDTSNSINTTWVQRLVILAVVAALLLTAVALLGYQLTGAPGVSLLDLPGRTSWVKGPVPRIAVQIHSLRIAVQVHSPRIAAYVHSSRIAAYVHSSRLAV